MTSALGPRLRGMSRIATGERALTAATTTALTALLAYVSRALRGNHMDPSTLSARSSRWDAAVKAHIDPAITDVFLAAWAATSRGPGTGDQYATRHLESVWNRLQGVPDTVFDNVRTELATGRAAGEGIPDLTTRVDTMLGDHARWASRAATIARTETIGANNAGAHAAAGATGEYLGLAPETVVKEWLATLDSRTRETHAEAEGQQVRGLEAPFVVGGSDLDYAGDPSGDPGETINCRCTVLYLYPGDPAYPAGDLPVAQSSARTTYATVYPGAPLEVAVDPGPQSDHEHAARTMTPEQLVTESTSTGGLPKAVARAELSRRGLAAAAWHDDTHTQEAAVTSTPPEDPNAPVDPTDEDDVEQPSCIIAALPAADDPVNGIGDEEKHATILFFGDLTTTDDATASLATIQAACEAAAKVQAPFTEQAQSVASLGDDGARVWMLAGTNLTAVHDALAGADGIAALLSNATQFPSYTPHVTIGYPTEDEMSPDGVEPELTLDDATETAAAAVKTIMFDRLAVWNGDSRKEYPLTASAAGTDDAPTDGPPADVQAAIATLLTWSQARGIKMADTPLPEDAPVPDGTPVVAQDIPADGEPFHGILWPEATASGDGRQIAAAATVWRDLPLPLMTQDAQMPGHDGAVRTGRIDAISRDSDTYTVPVIRYSGVWDTSPAALEAQRQVAAGVARGVSVDGDDMTVELQGSDGAPLDPMVDDFPADGIVMEVATSARVAGATICSIPAFQQAYIANGVWAAGMDEPGWTAAGDPIPTGAVPDAAPVDGDGNSADNPAAHAVMASAWSLTAAFLPVYPAAHFQRAPELDTAPPTGLPLTVTEDGRVFGHLAVWGTCHIGIDGICQEPPASASGYAHYAAGVAHLDDGSVVHVGPLTMGTGHAAMGLGARAAAEHYDNTGSVVADVVMGEDTIGPWFSGRVRATTTPEQVHAMVAAGKVSGDWREAVRGSGQLELVAALIVNVPGFSIPRPAVAASGGRATAMVASGIVARDEQTTPQALTAPSLAEITASVMAAIDRQTRAASAAGRLRDFRTTRASARITAAATTTRARRRTAALARLTKGA